MYYKIKLSKCGNIKRILPKNDRSSFSFTLELVYNYVSQWNVISIGKLPQNTVDYVTMN